MMNLQAVGETDKKARIWGYVIQAIIAALTALSGVFTGCAVAV